MIRKQYAQSSTVKLAHLGVYEPVKKFKIEEYCIFAMEEAKFLDIKDKSWIAKRKIILFPPSFKKGTRKFKQAQINFEIVCAYGSL